ncbi:MAG: dipeptidase [Gammaproteobacteria bacterium]|nr:dipeptidase [Gammaproteobacteria bacterium]
MSGARPIRIDCLQYCNWSEEIFQQMRGGGLDAAHVTIAYHENFRETVANIEAWNQRFERHADLIMPGRNADDVHEAQRSGRTAIFFGFQNCSPIEDDIGLVEICHALGARFMQLSYNNQSLLASGCYERNDAGISRMGRGVIKEMNRVGMAVDMSHSGERSTLEAIDISERPIAITHANPHSWHPALRNKSTTVLKALAAAGGMLGFSLYPHHLAAGSDCTLQDFCAMVAQTVELMGLTHVGIGSDLCQAQPDSVVEWMRNGRWCKATDFGEGSKEAAGFPPQPAWFRTNSDFPNLEDGLEGAGFTPPEVAAIVGGNWLDFFRRSFEPQE